MQAVDVPGTSHERFSATVMKEKARAWHGIVASLAEAQVFRWIEEPGTWARGGEMLFKDNHLAAGCQGNPGPKPSEGRHFALLLVTTMTGDPGRRDIAPGGGHELLA